jgi:hypothetical protein
VQDSVFLGVPELAKAIEHLHEEQIRKLMAYLSSPLNRTVRTNNHVERTNRMFRFLENIRYKWHHNRTLHRFVVLTLDEIWSNWAPRKHANADRSNSVKRHKSPHQGQLG